MTARASTAKTAAGLLHANPHTVAAILAADEWFRVDDLPANTAWRKFARVGILERSDERIGGRVDKAYHWRLSDTYRERAERVLSDISELPCGDGHTGFVHDDGAFVCRYCGAEHDERTIERVFG